MSQLLMLAHAHEPSLEVGSSRECWKLFPSPLVKLILSLIFVGSVWDLGHLWGHFQKLGSRNISGRPGDSKVVVLGAKSRCPESSPNRHWAIGAPELSAPYRTTEAGKQNCLFSIDIFFLLQICELSPPANVKHMLMNSLSIHISKKNHEMQIDVL